MKAISLAGRITTATFLLFALDSFPTNHRTLANGGEVEDLTKRGVVEYETSWRPLP